MKLTLIFLVLALFPLYSNAQYDIDAGIGIQHCAMGFATDNCGRSCGDPNAEKPCDISNPIGLQCFRDCHDGPVVLAIGNLHGFCEMKCKISMPKKEHPNESGAGWPYLNENN